MRKLALLVSLLVVDAATGADPDPGRQLVDNFVSDVVTLTGRFEQRLIDPDGIVVEESTGSLEIARPGRFRWVYTDPYEQWLVADGLNIWSYDVDLAQVTVKPQTDALSNTPALLLGGRDDALDDFEYGGSYVQEDTTWVRLTPLDTDSGFLRVDLGFRDGALSRMAFFDNLDQTTVVVLQEVVVNGPIDPDRFVFSVPDDVDLVGIPAVAEVSGH